jgi:glycogen(starch) synthase
LRYRMSRALESFALRHAGEVTTICEGLRADIAHRGIPSDRITVIPNAVDTLAFQFCAKPDLRLRHELGLDAALVIGFVGSFYHYEGLHLLLDAARKMILQHPQLRVLLVGGGPQEAALRAQAQALVHRYYGLIDVLAYPRLPVRLTELVTPLKPLEAMAQGHVFVASDVGGHRELVRHGETGHLFRAGDADALEGAIEAVLAQRDRWPQLRAQARRFVEGERTWAASVARYRAVYQRALQRHPDTASIRI